MSKTYLFTLEIDVLDETRLVEFARGKAVLDGLSEDEIDKTIPDAAAALQWIFDDNTVLQDAGYPAEIVQSSCEEVTTLLPAA